MDDPLDYTKYNISQLKALLKARQLKTIGSKTQLIERLQADDAKLREQRRLEKEREEKEKAEQEYKEFGYLIDDENIKKYISLKVAKILNEISLEDMKKLKEDIDHKFTTISLDEMTNVSNIINDTFEKNSWDARSY